MYNPLRFSDTLVEMEGILFMKHRISAFQSWEKERIVEIKSSNQARQPCLRNGGKALAAFFQGTILRAKTLSRTIAAHVRAASKGFAPIVQRVRMIAIAALRAAAQCTRLVGKAIQASMRKSVSFLRSILPQIRVLCRAIGALLRQSLSYLHAFMRSIIPSAQRHWKAVRTLLHRTFSFLCAAAKHLSALCLSALKRPSKAAPRHHCGRAILQTIYAHRGDVAYYALLLLAVSALTLGAVQYRNARNAPAAQNEARSVGAVSEILPEATETTEAPALGQRPVPGEILQPFSPDELVWSEELGQWQTHPGVDFAGCAGEAVQAVFDGRVTQIYDDPLYGGTVVVDCGDHGTLRYSSLSTLRLVQKDQALKTGEILGAAGTCPAEESLGEHLHLEWYVGGEAVDPTDFLER